MAQPTKPGNAERGWNDPPVFLHNSPGLGVPPQGGPPKRTALTKRVAHPGIFGGAANSAPSGPGSGSGVLPPNGVGPLPFLQPSAGISQSDESETGSVPSSNLPTTTSAVGNVILFPPANTIDVPKFTAPIIVPCMSPVEDSPIATGTMATNPVTQAQVNTDSTRDNLTIPDFDDDEQMLNFVLSRLQRTCNDCETSMQTRAAEDIKKKLDIFCNMWKAGKISYPVKSSMALLATALHKRRCDVAHQLHLDLMMDHVSEVGQWMVGIKRLIVESRGVDPPLSPTDTVTLFAPIATERVSDTCREIESDGAPGAAPKASRQSKDSLEISQSKDNNSVCADLHSHNASPEGTDAVRVQPRTSSPAVIDTTPIE